VQTQDTDICQQILSSTPTHDRGFFPDFFPCLSLSQHPSPIKGFSTISELSRLLRITTEVGSNLPMKETSTAESKDTCATKGTLQKGLKQFEMKEKAEINKQAKTAAFKLRQKRVINQPSINPIDLENYYTRAPPKTIKQSSG